jgi:hypothetical protein
MPDTLSPFAQQLAQVRTLIAGLTPRVAADRPFSAAKGTIPLARERQTADRTFEVTADAAPAISGSQFGTFRVEAVRSFTVSVRYDSKHQAVALDERMASDDEQIRDALQAGNARLQPWVKLIRLTGGNTDLAGDFRIRTLQFSVTYAAPL